MENKNTFNTRYLVELSLMSAIILLMAMTPLGYVKTPALSITLLTIPVAVGAILLGPKGGAILGAVFGATSFAQALSGSGMSAFLLQASPLGTLFLCFVPRILEGFLCGLLFQLMKRTGKSTISYYIAGFSCPLLNTILFMGTLMTIFYQTAYIQELMNTLGVSDPLAFVVALVGIQGAIEAAVCGILSAIISKTLAKVLHRT